ncbi:MAG: DUF934 domain-containing protein [Rhizobiaceae bacterium]|nr:DUF934 domain-containing protein [Rhizobiaceae bacterium]
MSILVRDNGFAEDRWEAEGGLFIDLEKFGQDVAEKVSENTCVDIPNDVHIDSLKGLFENAAMIRIPFPSFADGRGFSLAKQLRQHGYEGTLRAVGHVIADQYGFARSCGFDEVEIDNDLAARQPEDQWLARLPQDDLSYQNKWLVEREGRNF